MAQSRQAGQEATFIAKLNKETEANTRFFDISEGTGTLREALPGPTLPELIEITPKKMLSSLQSQISMNLQPYQRFRGTQLDRILQDFREGTLVFMGHAGSGKTTLLQHIARLALKDDLVSFDGIKLVLYIKCQEICPRTPISEEQLFCHGLSENEEKKAMRFIRKNPSQCLILIDSLETCIRYGEAKNTAVNPTVGKKKVPETLLRNLLSGRSYATARVIATSRDQSVVFDRDFSNARTVALCGLSTNSMLKIMIDYLGNKKGNAEWENLTLKSPHLASLCTTPVFLVYVLMAQLSESNKTFSLTTISEVMVRLLECFLRSEHSRHGKDTSVLLSSLKSISYEGLENGKFVFSKLDFKQHNLTGEKAGDYTSRHWLLKKLFRGTELIHFNHVSLQEAFAALYVAELSGTKFRQYAQRNLLPSSSMLQGGLAKRLVFGFVLDPEIKKNSAALLTDQEALNRNGKILLEVLKRFLAKSEPLRDKELICALHEAKEGASDLISSDVKSLKVDSSILNPNDVHAIGSVASRCRHLTELSLSRANLGPYHLEVLHDGIAKSSVKVEKLCLSENPNMAPEGLNTAGKIVYICKTKSVKLVGSILIPDDLASFNSGLGDYKMEDLDLSWNREVERITEMTPETEACEGVYYFKADIDSVWTSNLPAARLKHIKEQLQTQQFETFMEFDGKWRSASKELSKEVTEILPKVSHKLHLHGWKFDERDILSMENRLSELKIRGIKVIFATDAAIPDANRRLAVHKNLEYKESRTTNKVRCEVQDDSVMISWNEVQNADRYVLETLRDGQRVSKREISEPSFTESSVDPSTVYQFCVQPRYLDGTTGSTYLSDFVLTNPKSPMDVKTAETKDGICLTWQPAENDKIEKYVVKVFCDGVKKSTETCRESHYFLKNPIPGSSYYFKIQPYNKFERKGKGALSSAVNVAGTTEYPSSESRSNVTEKTLSQSWTAGSKRTFQEQQRSEFSLAISEIGKVLVTGIRTEEELLDWCTQRLQSKRPVIFQEIQIAHEPLDQDKIEFLIRILRLSSSVGELEFRDCEFPVDAFDNLKDTLLKMDCKVEELTMGAQKNISDRMLSLCRLVETFGAHILNLAENDVQAETVTRLLRLLKTNQGNCLTGLDVSFNKTIGNWEGLGKIWKKKSLSLLKAMNCDIKPQDLRDLRKGNPHGKLNHLDLSYNSELSLECFEIIPALFSDEADSLVLSECGITESEITKFEEFASPELEVKSIDVSYNEDLSVGGISVLGKMVAHRNTTDLCVAGCEIDGDMIDSLCDSLGSHNLPKLDISDNSSIGDKIGRVAFFTKKHQVVNLDISECGFDARQLVSFQEELGETKLSTLNISDSSRTVDMPYARSICRLIPHVRSELIAIFSSIEEGCLAVLQESLNRTGGDCPRITYATTTETASLLNGIKFTIGTEKKTLQKT